MNKDKKAIDAGFLDWNTLSLDQMVEYLRQKYMFSSTGESKCIYHLIEFYDKNKDASHISELIDFYNKNKDKK